MGLSEPQPLSIEAEELHHVFKSNGDRHPSQPHGLERADITEPAKSPWRVGAGDERFSEAEKAKARKERMKKDMEQWAKRSRKHDFERER